jgi:hypothetical protein
MRERISSGNFFDRFDEFINPVAFAAVNVHHRPFRARLFEQIHRSGVHFQNLDAVFDDVFRIGTQNDELIRMQHEANAFSSARFPITDNCSANSSKISAPIGSSENGKSPEVIR